MIPLKEYGETAAKWKRYTDSDLLQFTDKLLSFAFGYIVFDAAAYLDYCEENGLQDEESMEEFNLRFFHHGDRVNAIIRRIIE